MERINNKLKSRIMRRVYLTFFLRKAFSPLMVKMYALASFSGFLVTHISVANIMANMSHLTDIAAFYHFSISAFLNTEFAVQVLSVGALLAIFLLLKDVVKMHSTPNFSHA